MNIFYNGNTRSPILIPQNVQLVMDKNFVIH